MKKILISALVLTMLLTLAACGGKTPAQTDSGKTESGTSQPEQSKTEDNSLIDGADPDIPEGVLAKRSGKSIEDVVGKTETGKRIVRKLSDSFLNMTTGGWDNPPVAEYDVVLFGDDGYVSDSILYYVFADKTAFWNTFNDSAYAFVENWCREWSDTGFYYGGYTICAIFDADGDKKISWDEAWKEYNAPDDKNYILIQ